MLNSYDGYDLRDKLSLYVLTTEAVPLNILYPLLAEFKDAEL